MNLRTVVRTQWDRVAAIALAVTGAGTLALGVVGVQGTKVAVDQVSYLVSGALVGLFLLVLAATLWLSADLHDEWGRLDGIEAALAIGAPVLERSVAPPAEITLDAPADEATVAAAGVRHG
ncbi:MAG: hypothetical protein ACRDYF_09370 [Acidimicrobiia bacterium]